MLLSIPFGDADEEAIDKYQDTSLLDRAHSMSNFAYNSTPFMDKKVRKPSKFKKISDSSFGGGTSSSSASMIKHSKF